MRQQSLDVVTSNKQEPVLSVGSVEAWINTNQEWWNYNSDAKNWQKFKHMDVVVEVEENFWQSSSTNTFLQR